MSQLYQFTIKGMTCHACEKLISLDLQDAGYVPKSINHQTGQLLIPINADDISSVTKTIQLSNSYTVTDVSPVGSI